MAGGILCQSAKYIRLKYISLLKEGASITNIKDIIMHLVTMSLLRMIKLHYCP